MYFQVSLAAKHISRQDSGVWEAFVIFRLINGETAIEGRNQSGEGLVRTAVKIQFPHWVSSTSPALDGFTTKTLHSIFGALTTQDMLHAATINILQAIEACDPADRVDIDSTSTRFLASITAAVRKQLED